MGLLRVGSLVIWARRSWHTEETEFHVAATGPARYAERKLAPPTVNLRSRPSRGGICLSRRAAGGGATPCYPSWTRCAPPARPTCARIYT
eukprot:scaffold40369_cov51-Phaeocystis_antarctica.AAC.2